MVELLARPDAEEWRHKVGVAGPVDGSAKPTTRLLSVGGWVCKTRIDQIFATELEAREAIAATRDPGRAAGIWHEAKLWALMRVDQGWLPLTLCPELRTLRQLETFPERARAWIEMIQAGLDVDRVHQLGLDLNPSNFAHAPNDARLYYLDDELYGGLDVRTVANAIIARVPEEAAVDADAWRRWGAELRANLVLGALAWDQLVDEVRAYPLPDRYAELRGALVAGIEAPPRVARAARGSEEGLTCVFADVHGNVAALDAVLADARAAGARRFLFLGDAVGYGPEPAACVARIAELPEVRLVRGNHDHAIATGNLGPGMNGLARTCAEWTRTVLGVAELAWLGAMPLEQVGEGWMAVHGAPKDPHRFRAYVYELTYEDNLRHLRAERIPVCFYGHTHVQLIHVDIAGFPAKLAGPRAVELSPRNYWLVNPGSVGQPRDGDVRAGYALWNQHTGALETRRVSYDLTRTLAALRASDLPSQLANRLETGT